MAKITRLPDLEDLQHEPDNAMWSLCEHCETEPADFHVLCPARVLDYANRLVAEERARAVAVLDGLRDCIRSLSRFESDDYTAGWNDAADRALDAVNDTITTLPGSDR